MVQFQNAGIVYLRRSQERQATSLEAQLEWALKRAQELGVALDASLEQLRWMLEQRLSVLGAIYLDNAISGAETARPGYQALCIKLKDCRETHVFAFKRDRLARPDNPAEFLATENCWRKSGKTLVLSEGTFEPLPHGESDLGEDLTSLVQYHSAKEFLKTLAERVISAKLIRARSGARNGGSAPYGFVRILVDGSGNVLEELAPGRVVRQAGCHVEIRPDDSPKLEVWIQILDWFYNGWGSKRIAVQLNSRGIPSPDAGKYRRDNRARHQVTGKWNSRTVLELARNPAIIGLQEFGRRAEGKHRRMTPQGPRLLTENDIGPGGNKRLVYNSSDVTIESTLCYQPLYDKDKWLEIQEIIKSKGKSQRGHRRSSDLGKYPLSTRVIDCTEGCNERMYARTAQKRKVYACGRYMRTSGAECHHNQVDAEALLEFVLKAIRQVIARPELQTRLELALHERAAKQVASDSASKDEMEKDRLQLAIAEQDLEVLRLRGRLAKETHETVYEMLRDESIAVGVQRQQLQTALDKLNREVASRQQLEPAVQVQAAMRLLSQIESIVANPCARQELAAFIDKLGIWVGLEFTEALKGKKRKVRKLAGGRLYFGQVRPPVVLYGTRNCEHPHHDTSQAELVVQPDFSTSRPVETKPTGPAPEDHSVPARRADSAVPPEPVLGRPEGISFTKVNRGDRI